MRTPRYTPPGSMVEITMVVRYHRYLIAPIAELAEQIHGVIGRSLELSGVRIHGWTFLSNHAHLLVTADDSRQLSRFLQHLARNVTIAIQKLTGAKRGSVWEPRASIIRVLDDAAAIDRLRYLMANGVKEGLVATPLDWPGASSVRALLDDEPIRARWVSYDRLRRATRNNRIADPDEYSTEYEIELTPLPCWADLPREERRRRVRELYDGVVAQADHDRDGASPLGIEGILAADPTEHHELERTPAPSAHASSAGALAEDRAAFRAYCAHYWWSSKRFCGGDLTVEFPPGAFRPSGPYSRLFEPPPLAMGAGGDGQPCAPP